MVMNIRMALPCSTSTDPLTSRIVILVNVYPHTSSTKAAVMNLVRAQCLHRMRAAVLKTIQAPVT